MKTTKIKRYRLGFSRNFPKTHSKAGQKTYFEFKILASVYHETYFPVECTNCGWKGWSHLANGGSQIADTGDYSDIYCPKCGTENLEDIAEYEMTYYRNNENIWPKLHTIRGDYKLWKKRMAEVQAGSAVIELFYFEGKTCNSPQVVFATLDKDSGCGVQEISFFSGLKGNSEGRIHTDPFDPTKRVLTTIIAKNDGLSTEDFKELFKIYNLEQTFAIIHFTSFRY